MFERIKRLPKPVKIILGIFSSLLILMLLFYFSIYFGVFGKMPDTEELSQLKQSEATQVLSNDGQLIGKYYIFDRQPIKYEQLPQHLIDGLVATEDVRFYDHSGI